MTFYEFVRPFVLGVCRVLFRVKVRGTEKVPSEGPYIVAPSHRSLLDIPFAAYVTRRRIRFLAKKELFEKPFGKRLWLSLGGIPVDRGEADRKALQACIDALKTGEPVAVFPEGTRRKGNEVAELFDGAAWVAAKAGVPIVPVGIAGSEGILVKGKKLPRLERVAVVVGDVIPAPESTGGPTKRADVSARTAELQKNLQAAFDEARTLI